MSTEIVTANYRDPTHAKAIGYLMNCYARDPMGGGTALPGEITENLANELAKRDYAITLLCFVDGEAVGLANCFEMFSTFAGRPLLNIHDVVIIEQFRGRGLSTKLLAAVEDIAKQRGCCKLTLEVLSSNHNAKTCYQKFGFSDYQLTPGHGHALFWQKSIAPI